MPAATTAPPIFAEANVTKVVTAAEAMVARIRDLMPLPDDVDSVLAEAVRLRLEHPAASFSELAALADPPVTRDLIAGRLRRLLHQAERAANPCGHPWWSAYCERRGCRRP